MLQGTTEEFKIVIFYQVGSITLIIWAHLVLEVSITVTRHVESEKSLGISGKIHNHSVKKKKKCRDGWRFGPPN